MKSPNGQKPPVAAPQRRNYKQLINNLSHNFPTACG